MKIGTAREKLSIVLCAALLAACGRPQAPPKPADGDAIPHLGPPGAAASLFPAPSRPVADIVTDTWSSEDTRDRAGEADTVMRLLEVRPGMRVADVGAGSGYYTVRVSPVVGPGGRVIAQDIVPRYLERLRGRVRREGLANVTLALGEPHDPRLPRASADLVLLVHMYHEVEQPYAFLHNLRPALREGGRVAVVDLDRPTHRHGTPPALLRCEMEATGYRQSAFHDLGPESGYLAVFTPTGTAPRPADVRACPAASSTARSPTTPRDSARR
ncbi:MAG TPA: methyltransferase domain-containing protein [Longimicrobium sp.]|nr:methyltransferase domain-containing protein [Longimicrobium sp.]